MQFRTRTACLVGCLLLAGNAGASIAPDRFEEIRQVIRAGLVENSVPSIAVAVAQDGKIVWEQGFGWADREQRIAATEHSMYSLASISKPITATGLMTLVHAGKVNLDKPINDYLGNAKLHAWVGDAAQATVRRVANHTAGLPTHFQFFYADEAYPRPSMDETILRYGNLVTAPGEIYQYSNLGYGLLDYLIERTSGTSFPDFMRREVFIPLGLTHTSVNIGPGLERFAATRYEADGRPIPFYDFDHPGASAIFSSAHDLVRFGMFHLEAHLADQKPILADSMIEAMHQISAPPADHYGVGFDVSDKHGYHVIAHTGGMGGVATSLTLFPQQRLAIVVLSNSMSGLPFDIANRIAARMLPGWKLQDDTDDAHLEQQAKPLTPPANLVDEWKGILHTYTKDQPVDMQIRSDGEAHIKIGDQLPALIHEPQLVESELTGEFTARIDTPDTERYRYRLALDLRLRGDVLNGSVMATPDDERRTRNGLSHWIELHKLPKPTK